MRFKKIAIKSKNLKNINIKLKKLMKMLSHLN